MNIKVKLNEFLEYQKKHETYYLDKKHDYFICADSKKKLLEEMLDGMETDYDIIKNNNNYKILFKTKSNNEYRFDLMKEPQTNIFHLGFSNKNNLSYEDITNLNESVEVFSKLS